MSLKIGKYIKKALTENEALTTAVGGRVYPVVCPLERADGYPYVIFAMNDMQESSTKDGLAYDTVTEEITVFARNIDSLEDTAALVREAMARAFVAWRRSPDGFQISEQTMTAGAEDYSVEHDGYFLKLFYQIETDKI